MALVKYASDAIVLASIPLVGPGGRWHLLAGRLFEEIPDAEIKSFIGDQQAVAFSKMGVFEYTPTPNLALAKFHAAFPLGSKLFLERTGSKSEFMSPTGEKLSLGDYAKLCGFKVTRLIHYTYRTYKWMKHANESAIEPETHPDVQFAMQNGDMWGVGGWIIENTGDVHVLPVSGTVKSGGKPPTNTFQIQ